MVAGVDTRALVKEKSSKARDEKKDSEVANSFVATCESGERTLEL